MTSLDDVRTPWRSSLNISGQARQSQQNDYDSRVGISTHLREIDQWRPQLEPVMSRLSLKVRRWQLGRDDDYSLLKQGSLKEPIEEIARGLQGFGQPLQILFTLPWPWIEPILGSGSTSWQTNLRSSRKPLTAAELDAALEDRPPSSFSDASTWVSLRDDRRRSISAARPNCRPGATNDRCSRTSRYGRFFSRGR